MKLIQLSHFPPCFNVKTGGSLIPEVLTIGISPEFLPSPCSKLSTPAPRMFKVSFRAETGGTPLAEVSKELSSYSCSWAVKQLGHICAWFLPGEMRGKDLLSVSLGAMIKNPS